MLKINFENQILALFDVYFWPFNKSHEKINIIFVIRAIIASTWNVFIEFRWHDEKLIAVHSSMLKLKSKLDIDYWLLMTDHEFEWFSINCIIISLILCKSNDKCHVSMFFVICVSLRSTSSTVPMVST